MSRQIDHSDRPTIGECFPVVAMVVFTVLFLGACAPGHPALNSQGLSATLEAYCAAENIPMDAFQEAIGDYQDGPLRSDTSDLTDAEAKKNPHDLAYFYLQLIKQENEVSEEVTQKDVLLETIYSIASSHDVIMLDAKLRLHSLKNPARFYSDGHPDDGDQIRLKKALWDLSRQYGKTYTAFTWLNNASYLDEHDVVKSSRLLKLYMKNRWKTHLTLNDGSDGAD